MGKLYVEIDDELEKDFRKRVITKYGSKKGVLSKMVGEAICNWLEEDNMRECLPQKDKKLTQKVAEMRSHAEKRARG